MRHVRGPDLQHVCKVFGIIVWPRALPRRFLRNRVVAGRVEAGRGRRPRATTRFWRAEEWLERGRNQSSQQTCTQLLVTCHSSLVTASQKFSSIQAFDS